MPDFYFAWLIWLAAALIVFVSVLWARNIREAQLTGLPYVLSPIHELEIWAFLTDPILRWLYREYPIQGRGWPKWARFMVRDWHYSDKGLAHEEFGPVFLVVSPGGLVCYVADPDAAVCFSTRRRAFPKPRSKMKMLEPFGPNVVSTDGDLWRFHSRITLPSFGEGLQDIVWAETKRQTDLLCQSWSGESESEMADGLYKLTMNATCHAIFGLRADWANGGDPVPQGHQMSLVGAMSQLIQQLPFILLLPQWALRLLPSHRANLAYSAYRECEQYMEEFVAQEKDWPSQGSEGQTRRDNLLTALLRSTEGTVEAGKQKSLADGRAGLTKEEVKGNIFVYLLAGYETTANTMIYSCIALALYPNIQERARQEVDAICAQSDQDGKGGLSYPEDFRKFRYLVAFMYEVLRVFPTAFAIARQVESDQELTMAGPSPQETAKVVVPRGTYCVVNVTGCHYSRSNWPSPHILEPLRWLASKPNRFDPLSSPSPLDNDEPSSIPGHQKGTFMTFGEGPRACLGRNMARVEFVAFFACLLRNYKLELGEGVSAEALEWLLRCRSGGSPFTLTLPEPVKLRLVPKGTA